MLLAGFCLMLLLVVGFCDLYGFRLVVFDCYVCCFV